jgi:hypothetical protein
MRTTRDIALIALMLVGVAIFGIAMLAFGLFISEHVENAFDTLNRHF